METNWLLPVERNVRGVGVRGNEIKAVQEDEVRLS
jgi:hypothetical protein